MNTKWINLVLAGLMTVSTVSVSNVYAAGTEGVESTKDKNHMLAVPDDKITASSEEAGSLKAKYVKDGKASKGMDKTQLDETRQKRWATNADTNINEWINIEFPKVTQVQEIMVDFWRDVSPLDSNVKSFEITYVDANGKQIETPIKVQNKEISEERKTGYQDKVVYQFDEPVNMKSFKLQKFEVKKEQWNNVSIEEIEVYSNKKTEVIEDRNDRNHLHLGVQSLTATNAENNTNVGSKINDNNHSTRWATAENKWKDDVVHAVFKQPTKIKEVDFYLDDRGNTKPSPSNIKSFEVLFKTKDGSEVAKTVTNTKKGEGYSAECKLILDQAVVATEMKVHKFVIDESGYKNLSIREIEVYSNEQSSRVSLDSVVQSIEGQTIEKGTAELSLPTVPEGFEVKFNGCDLEQIIDANRQIHQPLVDKVVNVNWDVIEKSSGKKKNTGDLRYTVKGEHTVSEEGKNTSPVVIPEIQEWYSNSTDKLDINKLKAINYSDDSLKAIAEEFAKDFFAFSGKKLTVSKLGTKTSGTIFIHKDINVNYLGEEGYSMNITADNIEIKSNYVAGNMYGLQTILQMYKQDNTGFKVGTMHDYPRYPVRGLLLDVARKPISLEMMKEITRTMRYYKMNDFQAHLSDNLIFLERYGAHENENEAYKAYEAFRLESGLKNEKGETPTAKDYAISKKDFKDFILNERALGMNIVPEIDVPAHAISFTKVWPELAVKNQVSSLNSSRPLIDHFDLTKKEARDKIKEIFDDYTKGNNPTFDEDTIVHIGADEFLYSYKSYRQWLNEIVPHVKETNTVRMWGGLTWIKDNPLTPIDTAAIENVQMNLWSVQWADGKEMYDLGYQLINTLDTYGYMVPNGNYGRGAYGDFLNLNHVYNNFACNKVASAGGDFLVPSGDNQMLGGAYAIWNDNIDKYSAGLTESDMFVRFFDALPVYAEKTWAATGKEKTLDQIKSVSKTNGIGPSVNPYYQVNKTGNEYEKYDFASMNDLSQNKRHLSDLTNATLDNGVLNLKGGNSFVKTPIEQLGNGHSLSFEILINKPYKPGQILFEETAPYGTHDIRIMDDGRLGFTRELHDYYFDYKLPVGKKVKIEITTEQQKTNLYVNDEFISSATGRFFHNDMVKKDGITNATFALPLERIGSSKNAIVASIDNVVVADKTDKLPTTSYDQGKSKWTASVESETDYNNDKEGLIRYAFDGKAGTIWHSNWKGTADKVPTSDGKPGVGKGEDGAIETTIMFNDTKKVNQISFTNRTDNESGQVTQASLYIKPAKATKATDNDGWVLVADKQEFVAGAAKKTFEFTSQDIVGFKFVAHQSNDGWVAVSEFDINNLQRDTTLYVQCDSTQGNVTFDKTNYNYGDIVTVTASAKEGYVFAGWYDAILGTQLSDKAEYTFTMKYNTALEARFRPSVQVDKGLLESKITEAEALDKTLYTDSSYKVLEDAIKEAKNVMSNVNATQVEVDAMVDKLNKAIDQLVKVTPEQPVEVTKDKLQALVDSALKFEEEDYTKETYKALVDALEKAKAVLVDKDATQDAVNEAYDMLNKAIKALVKVDVVQPQKPTQPESQQQQQTPSTNDSTRIFEFVVLGSVALVGLYMVLRYKKEHN